MFRIFGCLDTFLSELRLFCFLFITSIAESTQKPFQRKVGKTRSFQARAKSEENAKVAGDNSRPRHVQSQESWSVDGVGSRWRGRACWSRYSAFVYSSLQRVSQTRKHHYSMLVFKTTSLSRDLKCVDRFYLSPETTNRKSFSFSAAYNKQIVYW